MLVNITYNIAFIHKRTMLKHPLYGKQSTITNRSRRKNGRNKPTLPNVPFSFEICSAQRVYFFVFFYYYLN